jgi:hypothetical protein
MSDAPSVFVIAPDAASDHAIARVVDRLGPVRLFGLGGAALASLARGRGALELASGRRAVPRAQKHRCVVSATKHTCAAAIIASCDDWSLEAARNLRARGVPVLLYRVTLAPISIAPELLREAVDRVATPLPDEVAFLREHGIDAHAIAHPSGEITRLDRNTARTSLGLTPLAETVALLPGSRTEQAKSVTPLFLEAYERLRQERGAVDARVLLAPSLPGATVRWVERLAAEHGVQTFQVDPALGAVSLLSAFDVALVPPGTASLEAVLAGVAPLIVELESLLQAIPDAISRLRGDAAPKRKVQQDGRASIVVSPLGGPRVSDALGALLDEREEYLAQLQSLRDRLLDGARPADRVAGMVKPWLAREGHWTHVPVA